MLKDRFFCMKGAAFFDVDNTLLRGNISLMYAGIYWKERKVPFIGMLKCLYMLMLHKLNLLTLEKLSFGMMSFLTGHEVEPERSNIKKLFEEFIIKRINPKVEARLKEHQREGMKTVLLTNAPHLFVDNLSRYLGTDVIASNFDIVDGKFTGRIKHVCYAEKKLELLKEYAKKNRIDLKKSWYYADSYSDRFVMEKVGHPVVVNGDWKLRRLGRGRFEFL